MIVNRSIPQATVIPELAYDDVSAAAEWLGAAFGFRMRLRIGSHRIQMTVSGPAGEGAVVVTARDRGLNAQSQTVLVRVADANAHHAHAKARGARILREPEDHIYGERQYSAEDIGGHVWTFSQSIADSDPRDWGGELMTL